MGRSPETGPYASSDTLAEYPGLPLVLQRETNVSVSSPRLLPQSQSPDPRTSSSLVFPGEGQEGVRMREGGEGRGEIPPSQKSSA